MKWTKKNKREKSENSKTIPEKKMDVFNYTPVHYSFSEGFISIIDDMEAFAKRKIERIPINELSDDVCDSEIDALCKVEIAIASEEYTKHICVIKEIIDSCTSEVVRANEVRNLIVEDCRVHKSQRDDLMKLQKKLIVSHEEV